MVLTIIFFLLGICGLIFGIARGILCVKKDAFTAQENKKLQELNESLQQTRKSLQEENALLANSNKEFSQIRDKNIEETKKLTDKLNQLFWEKQKNITEIQIQEKEKESLNAQIGTLHSSIDELTSNQKSAARAAFSAYCDALDFEYKEKEREFDEDVANLDILYNEHHDAFLREMASNEQDINRRREELERDLDIVRSELAKIKSSRAAAIEAQLREQEIKEKETFYTLQLSEADRRDVAYLKSIEFNLREARPLRMLIWTTFYRDKLNDLAARVGAVGACGIYKLTHTETGIAYIGQARDIKTRWSDHCKCALGIDTPVTSTLYAFMREKGVDNFTFEVLEKCSAAELNEKEKFYIDLYQTYDFGLNGNKGVGK